MTSAASVTVMQNSGCPVVDVTRSRSRGFTDRAALATAAAAASLQPPLISCARFAADVGTNYGHTARTQSMMALGKAATATAAWAAG